jgi:hypothetical protein
MRSLSFNGTKRASSAPSIAPNPAGGGAGLGCGGLRSGDPALRAGERTVAQPRDLFDWLAFDHQDRRH